MRKRSQSMFVSEKELQDRYVLDNRKKDSSGEEIENEEQFTTRDWTAKNELALVNKLKRCIPKNDDIPFDERLEEIDWHKVKFDQFDERDVKSKFEELLEKARTFRLLREILSDLTNEIFTKIEIPLKPISAFALFMSETKRNISEKREKLDGSTSFFEVAADCYKKLTDEKKEEYMQRTVEMKNSYHEVMQKLNLDANLGVKERKFMGPLRQYYIEKYRGVPKVKSGIIRKEYASLAKEEKLSLILRWVGVEKGEKLNLNQYEDAKTVLTKEEMALLDDYEGKPRRPANGYCMFLKDYYENCTDPKVAFLEVRNQWQSLSSAVKQEYLEKAAKARKQFKIDYKNYLNSLPLDRLPTKRQKKRKKRSEHGGETTKGNENRIENYFISKSENQSNNENDGSVDEGITSGHEEETEDANARIEDASEGKKKKKKSRPKKSDKTEELPSKIGTKPNINEVEETESATPKKRKHLVVETAETEMTPKKKKKKSSELKSEEVKTSKIETEEDLDNRENRENEEELTDKKSKKKKKRKEVVDMEETRVDDTTHYESEETVAEKIEKLLALKPPKSCYKYFLKNLYDGPKKQAKSQYESLSADEKKSINKKYKRAKRKFLENFQTFANSLSSQELEENEEAIGNILEDQGDESDEES